MKMAKALRICHLGHKSMLERSGGVEVVVYELATRMAARGHKVTCYNRSGHHVSGKEYDVQKQSEYKDVKLKYVPTLQKRGLAAVTSSMAASVCAAFGRFDVVHIHAEGPAFMCWLPKLFGKRVIVTVHGLDWQREKWKKGFGAKYIHAGEEMAVRFSDEIIVLSRNVQEYFKNTYHRETKWIPNGVSRPNCVKAEDIAHRFGLEKDSYILFLGRLVPEKGIHYLIEAFKRVSTDKKLVIAGGTSDTDQYIEELKRMAEDDHRIIFTGFVQGRILEELFSNNYVYVLPSDVEGMPLSLLESMSYGNCCLTSDIEECTEVTGDHGAVFCKGDTHDLSEKLQLLCNDSGLVERYRVEAAEYICQRYNWDAVVDQTLALYKGETEI